MNKIYNIGRVVRYHREKAGITQKELAELAGVGKTVVFDLEKGKETIRFDTLNKILNALNISIQLNSPLMNEYKSRFNEKS